jgi:hypothetical protein
MAGFAQAFLDDRGARMVLIDDQYACLIRHEAALRPPRRATVANPKLATIEA